MLGEGVRSPAGNTLSFSTLLLVLVVLVLLAFPNSSHLLCLSLHSFRCKVLGPRHNANLA
jgi:hypothetical protein